MYTALCLKLIHPSLYVFILVPFTVWSYIIPTSIVDIQLLKVKFSIYIYLNFNDGLRDNLLIIAEVGDFEMECPDCAIPLRRTHRFHRSLIGVGEGWVPRCC